MWDWRYGYYQKELVNAEKICFDKNIYVPLTLHRNILDWCHLCINHPGGSRLEITPRRYATGNVL